MEITIQSLVPFGSLKRGSVFICESETLLKVNFEDAIRIKDGEIRTIPSSTNVNLIKGQFIIDDESVEFGQLKVGTCFSVDGSSVDSSSVYMKITPIAAWRGTTANGWNSVKLPDGGLHWVKSDTKVVVKEVKFHEN